MLEDFLNVKLIIFIIIAVLASIKTIFFLQIPGRKNFSNWIHYSIYQLVNSKTHKIESAKKMQNMFTTFISIAVFADIIMMFLLK
jgi:uncharacterized membrane protein YhaH (DUF805 family)